MVVWRALGVHGRGSDGLCLRGRNGVCVGSRRCCRLGGAWSSGEAVDNALRSAGGQLHWNLVSICSLWLVGTGQVEC